MRYLFLAMLLLTGCVEDGTSPVQPTDATGCPVVEFDIGADIQPSEATTLVGCEVFWFTGNDGPLEMLIYTESEGASYLYADGEVGASMIFDRPGLVEFSLKWDSSVRGVLDVQ